MAKSSELEIMCTGRATVLPTRVAPRPRPPPSSQKPRVPIIPTPERGHGAVHGMEGALPRLRPGRRGCATRITLPRELEMLEGAVRGLHWTAAPWGRAGETGTSVTVTARPTGPRLEYLCWRGGGLLVLNPGAPLGDTHLTVSTHELTGPMGSYADTRGTPSPRSPDKSAGGHY